MVKRNRHLKDEDDVFSHNAWDDLVWTDFMRDEAQSRINQQRLESASISQSNISQIEQSTGNKWDQFYKIHSDKFYKDRKWIGSEFPELLAIFDEHSGPANIFEVGCGVGNSVAHMIQENRNENLHIFCCDLSPCAIETLKRRQFYANNHDRISAFQANICDDFHEKIAKVIPAASLDFITLIFTFSALKPESMGPTLLNLASLLKPGGMILFRDYAQYDLTQLRFKGKSYLRDNYYVRADGTTSYFFTNQFLEELFASAGLTKVELTNDNRMLVNRRKSLKMFRCWVQAKYKKDLLLVDKSDVVE